ncbi:MAG: hypothetical protein RL143_1241, partial [Pseudomonadota bacterium]
VYELVNIQTEAHDENHEDTHYFNGSIRF